MPSELDPQSLQARVPLTPAIFHILLVLARGRAHGYAIMQDVEQLTEGQVRLGPGTLYRSLQRMHVEGLIDERADPVGDDPRRRSYQLTELGRGVARAEARRLEMLVTAARKRKLLGARSRSRRKAGRKGGF